MQAIQQAHLIIPPRILDLMGPYDYFCNADPVFAGLHTFEDASYGRSYRNTAHVIYPNHQKHRPRAERLTTVILHDGNDPDVVVHELGHVLHRRLKYVRVTKAVSWYAEGDRYEAFAEAFTSWVVPGYAQRPDDATIALLEALAVG